MSHAESVDSGILDTTVESFDRHYAVKQCPSVFRDARFLLSKQGEWINGQLLYSNGGYPKGRLPV
jgi:3-oxoacyl-[acyl-carrier protein] reductase